MVIVTDTNGNLVKTIPENVYQSSNNANSIVLLAPFASNLQVMVAYKLPNGILTTPTLMASYGEVPSEYNLNGWTIDIDQSLTEYYGTVDMQFQVITTTGIIVASIGCSFNVLRGVAPILPATPTQTIYEQILQALSSIQSDIVNGWLESKALLPFDLTFKYSLNAMVYDNGAFYLSLIENNLGNPLTDSASWENQNITTIDMVNALISAHNTSGTAHADIRQEIANIINGTTPLQFTATRAFGDQNGDNIVDTYVKKLYSAVEQNQSISNNQNGIVLNANSGGGIANTESQVETTTNNVRLTFSTTGKSAEIKTDATGAIIKSSNLGNTNTLILNGGIVLDEGDAITINGKPLATKDFVNSQGFITNAVNNLVNYYLKSETYTQAEVNALIGAISTISFEIVSVLPTTGQSNIIYLLLKSSGETGNIYEEYVWINNTWELIGTTQIDLSNYLAKDNTTAYTPTGEYNPATKGYTDDQDIAFIGREQQVDFNCTLTGTVITGELDSSISTFTFTNGTGYLFHLVLPLTTLTGDLNNTYTVNLKDSQNNTININCIFEQDITKTSNVGMLCQLQNYNVNTGYSWEFYGHYSQLDNSGSIVRVVYTDTVVRESNPSMTGQDLYTAIVNNTLKVGSTVLCNSNHSQSGVIYKQGHNYLITGSWLIDELILDTLDITPLAEPDNVTITLDTNNKLTLTQTIINACQMEWAE